MRLLKYLLLLTISALPAFAQGVHRFDQVITRGNGIAANIVPYASVKVCAPNTGCVTLAAIYSDIGLTKPLANPLTADAAGNFSYYFSAGCVDEQYSAPSLGTVTVTNVCLGIGAAGNPAGSNTQVQVNVNNAFGVDPLFTNNKTTHNTESGAFNGTYNSDLFTTGGGNNGVSTLQSNSTICQIPAAANNYAGGCNLEIPLGSTSTENIYNDTTVSNSQITDNRWGSESHFHYNYGEQTTQNPAGLNRDGDIITCGLFGQPVFISGVSHCLSFNDTYSQPGVYFGSPWSVHAGLTNNTWINGRSIGQQYSNTFWCLKAGDCGMNYNYFNVRSAETATSDESNVMQSWELTEYNPPIGSVVGASGAFNTTLSTNLTGNSTTLGDGMIAVDTSQIMSQGLIVSATNNTASLNSVTTSDTHATSTFVGSFNGACGSSPTLPTTRNAGIQTTCAITTISGTLSAASGSTVCIGDWRYPEQVGVGAASPTSITIGLTAVAGVSPGGLTMPHPSGTIIEQGGMCGGKMALGYGYTDPTTQGTRFVGYFTSYFVVGSQASNTLDVIVVYKGGENGSVPVTIPNSPPLQALGTLTRSGTTVTATINPQNSYRYNQYVAPTASQICVSGVSGGSYNSCSISNISVTNNGNTITYTDTGSGSTPGTGGQIQVNGLNNYINFCGAETTAVLGSTTLQPDNSGGSPGGTGMMNLEPNNCRWTSGDKFNQPNFYAQSWESMRLLSVPNTSFTGGGANVGLQIFSAGKGNEASYEIQIGGDFLNAQVGFGGDQAPHGAIIEDDNYYQNFFLLENAPINNGTAFFIGAPPPQSPWTSYTLFDLGGSNETFMNYESTTGTLHFFDGEHTATINSDQLETVQEEFTAFLGAGSPNAYLGNYGGLLSISATPATGNNTVSGTGFDGSASVTAGTFTAATLSAGSQPPEASGVFTVGTAGSTTYTYVGTCITQNGETPASATNTTTTGNATLSGSNFNEVKFTFVAGCQGFNVYRTSTTGGLSAGKICSNVQNFAQFCEDTGQATIGGSAPTTNTTGVINLNGSQNFTEVQGTAGLFIRYPTPEYHYKQLLLNPKCTQAARLEALRALEHPPLALLDRLLRDPATPQRLLRALAESYAVESLLRQQRNK
jgi:hypothetical protein